MSGPIPFEIPAKFAALLRSGNLVRVGALLKKSGTGQIVAHLQETGALQRGLRLAVGAGANPLALPLALAETASSIAANVQLVELKAMMQALGTLQLVNLGAVVAGIGVNIAGFKLLADRIATVQQGVDALAETVKVGFREMFERDLRAHFSSVKSLCERAQQAETRTDRKAALRSVSDELATEFAYFSGELQHMLAQPSVNEDILGSTVRMVALCGAGRTECLLRANEVHAARRVAADIGNAHRQLFDNVTVPVLARKIAGKPHHPEGRHHEYKSLRNEQKGPSTRCVR